METNRPSGLLALFDPQVQRNIVTGIREWVLENEPAIIEATQVTCGLLLGAAQLIDHARTAIRTLLEQPQVVNALVAVVEWAPRLEAAAQAAERIVALHAQAEQGVAAFAANDKATVTAFTCEVLGLRPNDASYVWMALAQGDWRAEWNPITFLKRRVWAMRMQERRRELRWAGRNQLLLDRGWNEGGKGLLMRQNIQAKWDRRAFEQRHAVAHMVLAGEISADAAFLLEARLAGVSRESWEALGWEERRMLRAWRELCRAKALLKKRLLDGSFVEEPADWLPE